MLVLGLRAGKEDAMDKFKYLGISTYILECHARHERCLGISDVRLCFRSSRSIIGNNITGIFGSSRAQMPDMLELNAHLIVLAKQWQEPSVLGLM